MKLLNGQDLALYIKERQQRDVRVLSTSGHRPKLVIVRTNPAPVVNTYMRLKQRYGDDIGVEVEVLDVVQTDALKAIKALNADSSVDGIIVQMPLPDLTQTDEILNAVGSSKDVDGLGRGAVYDPATPTAINWLLAGYNIDLRGKNILIIGQGRLVGAPLARLWEQSGLSVHTADVETKDLRGLIQDADVIVTATGNPGLVTSEMLKTGVVVVDAGVSTDSNGLIGDVDSDARQREDITITPEKGGVGPLTIAALFDNVIRAARESKDV